MNKATIRLLCMLVAIWLGSILNASAQIFTKQEEFLADLNRLFEKSRSEKIGEIKSGIQGIWETGFSATQKNQLFNLCNQMYKKKYRYDTHFEDFFAVIYYGKNNGKLDEKKLSQFLGVADSTVHDLPVVVGGNFFKVARTFIEDNSFYRFKETNKVQVQNGNWAFRYGKESLVDIEILDEEVSELPPSLDPVTTVTDTTKTADKKETTETADDWGWDSGDDDWGSSGDWDAEDDWGSAGSWEDVPTETTTDKKTSDKKATDKKTTTKSESLPPVWADYTPVDPDEMISDTEKLAGPYLQIDSSNLMIQTPYDTVYIYNTSGAFIFSSNKYAGNRGRFDWSSVGLSTSDVYCDFDKFVFEVTKMNFSAKNAKMYYHSKIDGAVNGKFEFWSMKSNNSATPTYPRFKSYNSEVKIKNILDNVVYKGGFSLTGDKISSSSFNRGASSITVLNEKSEIKFRVYAREKFVFNQKNITTKEGKLVIYLTQKDSLMHPAMQVSYDAKEKTLTARKDKYDKKYAPFIDTYHNMQIQADYIKWNTEVDSVDLSIISGRTVVPAILESDARFDEDRFRSLQSLYPFHPLVMSLHYATKVLVPPSLSFDCDNMAMAMKQDKRLVRASMRELAQGGYIDYYESQGIGVVQILRKGVLYGRAVQKQLDYDNILLRSLRGDLKNMTFYLDSLNLKVRGVQNVVLSSTEKMQVRAEPSNGEVVIKKNRDMEFSGKLIAKDFIFNGKNFQFAYDTFKVEMPQIDSMQFIVHDTIRHEDGRIEYKDSVLANSIKDMKGTFYIAHPNNKSGNRPIRNYPIFVADKGGNVNFGGKEILHGAYHDPVNIPPKIRFDLDAFKLDSISERNPSQMDFKGMFRTDGIFPDFQEKVRVMKDGSLGFEHKVPAGGYPLYKGKGQLTQGQISLNNAGIRAGANMIKSKEGEDVLEKDAAEISYLAASLQSNDFIFYSDSVTSMSRDADKLAWSKGNIKKGAFNKTSYPDVEMEDYSMRWVVQQDSMLLSSKPDSTKPFLMYDKTAEFNGTLALNPNNLKGRGWINTQEAIITSPRFTFFESSFNGNNTTFKIKSEDINKPAILATNVKFDYNLIKKEVNMSAENVGEQSFEFPYSQYKTSLAHAYWNITEKSVKISMDEEADPLTQKFVSVHPEQEGLSFNAGYADYDLSTYTLNVGSVPFILVVDTEIYPKDSKVVIKKDAYMEPLAGAELVVNQVSRYYQLTKGNIQIHSRNSFTGDANYDYTNDIAESHSLTFKNFAKDLITLEKVPSDSLKKLAITEKLINTNGTTAISEVQQNQHFIMEDGKQFRGKVTMKAWLPSLEFDGEVQLTLDGPDSPWLPIKSGLGGDDGKGGSTSSGDIVVANEEVNGKKLALGLYIDKETNIIYTPLLSEKRNNKDKAIFMANGVLKPNTAEQKTVVMSDAERKKLTYKGGRFEYSTRNGYAEFEGKLDIFEDDPKHRIITAGLAKGKYANNDYTIDMMIGIAYEEKGQSFKVMGEELSKYLDENRSRDDIKRGIRRNDVTLNKLAELVEDKAVKNFEKRFEPGRYTISDVMSDFALVISSAEMKWSETQQAFYSTGDIVVSNIFKEDIDAVVQGAIEIPLGNDNEINMYLEFSPDNWFLIQRKGKDTNILSSNEAFNAAVSDPKSKDKFKLLDETEKAIFLNKFRSVYK